MTSKLSHAGLLLNQESYGQSQCPQCGVFLSDCSWPGCGSEVIDLLAEYRPLTSITGYHNSRNSNVTSTGRLWPVGLGRQRQLCGSPVRKTWIWLTACYRETATSALGRVRRYSGLGSRHSGLSGAERQLTATLLPDTKQWANGGKGRISEVRDSPALTCLTLSPVGQVFGLMQSFP